MNNIVWFYNHNDDEFDFYISEGVVICKPLFSKFPTQILFLNILMMVNLMGITDGKMVIAN
jgi:hypothetical protein